MAAALLTAVLAASDAAAKPVFDCSDPTVRRAYPAQCPEVGVPYLIPGGGGDGSGQCRGLCGLIDRVLDGIGLGGFL